MSLQPTTEEPRAQIVEPPHRPGPPWAKIIAAVVVAALIVVSIVLFGRRQAEREHARRLEALKGQWAGLEGCLLGEALKTDETAASRFRAIQLNVVGIPRDARAKAREQAWPGGCASFASGVAEQANAAETNATDLETSANALSKDLRDERAATADLGKLVDQVWKNAAAAQVEAPPADAARAPKPTHPILGPEAFRAPSGVAGDFALSSVKPDPAPTTNLRFLVDDPAVKNGPLWCSVSGIPSTLVCSRFGSADIPSSSGLSMVGTTDPGADPWVFVGDRGQLGVFRPSGTVAVRGQTAWGASVAADDSASFLLHATAPGVDPNEMRLLRAPPSGDLPPAIPVLRTPEVASPSDTTLVWDWVIVWAGPNAPFPHHLIGHAVMPNSTLGAAIDIGDAATLEPAGLPDTSPRFSTCRSGGNTAVRVHGAHADALVFYTGTVWTKPVALATQGGELFCEANQAVVTKVNAGKDGKDEAPVIEQSRCNATGCTLSRLALSELFGDTDVAPRGHGSFAAAEQNGKLLLLWNAGVVGGLRMRLASLDKLKSTPDVVVADEQGKSGPTVVTDLRVLSAADVSVLLVKTGDGTRIFSVDGAGKVVALGTRT